MYNILTKIYNISLLIVCLGFNNYEDIRVKFNKSYVNKFHPYLSDCKYNDIEIFKIKLKNNYNIIIYNKEYWIDTEPGDFRKIKIIDKNGIKYEFENSDAFVFFMLDALWKYTIVKLQSSKDM